MAKNISRGDVRSRGGDGWRTGTARTTPPPGATEGAETAGAPGDRHDRRPRGPPDVLRQALQRAAQAAWATVGAPPTVVGATTGTGAGERITVKLADKAHLAAKAVVFLFPPATAPRWR